MAIPKSAKKRGANPQGKLEKPVIYVMVTPEQHARFTAAADRLGMSMREWATIALDRAAAETSIITVTGNEPPLDMPEPGETESWLMRRVNQHTLRINALEQQLRSLENELAHHKSSEQF